MVELVQALTWVDFVIIFGLIRGAYAGYHDGIVREILRVFWYIVTLAVIVSFSDIAGDYLHRNTFLSPKTANGLSIAAMGLVTYLILKVATDLILKWAALENNFLFKILGLFSGVLRWAGILSAVFYGLSKINAAGLGTDIYLGSQWGRYVAPIAPTVIEFLEGIVPSLGIWISPGGLF